MTRQDFHNFVKFTIKEYPMIYGIEWVPKISHATRKSFISKKKDDFPEFDIQEIGKDKNLVPAAARDYYYPLTFIEPMDPEKRTILGFDVASISDRKATILKALREKCCSCYATDQPYTSTRNGARNVAVLSSQWKCSGRSGTYCIKN